MFTLSSLQVNAPSNDGQLRMVMPNHDVQSRHTICIPEIVWKTKVVSVFNRPPFFLHSAHTDEAIGGKICFE